MSITNGPNLGLMVNGLQGEAHYSQHLALLRGLDGLVMPSVKGYLVNTPPGSPADGDCYIVGAAPTGVWAGQGGKVARWSSVMSAWEFFAPKNGWTVEASSVRETYRFTGGSWEIFTAINKAGDTGIGNLSMGALTAAGVAVFMGGSSLGLTIRANGMTTEEFNGADSISMNYRGYQNGVTQFRSLSVYDGKTALVMGLDGATKAAIFTGSVQNGAAAWFHGTAEGGSGATQPLIRARGVGYSPSVYRGVQIGVTGEHVALFVDPGSVVGPSFSGTTNELLLPNAVDILQANTAGTNWRPATISMNDGVVTFGGVVTSLGPITPGTYTVATLPAGTNGASAYASNGRKVSEGAGAGTGSRVVYSNGAWRRLSDETTITA